jgi:hypothetical protein
MVVAFAALAVALGGTAWAASKIDTDDIKNGAVTTQKLAGSAVKAKKISSNAVKGNKIADNAVKTSDINNLAVTAEKLADGTITGAKIADNSIGDAKLSDYEVIGGSYILATATEGASDAAARDAAPEIALFTKGQISLYAKCYRNTATDTTFGFIYTRVTADGAIQQGTDTLNGGPAATDFLNTTTLEVDRELDSQTIVGNDASIGEAESAVASPDGTGLLVDTYIAVKNGDFAGGNGLYGAGNKCVFGGTIEG